jgi:hypothetical protein
VATTKICTKCQKPFPATTEFFYQHPQTKDGLFSRCKVCANTASAAWSAANPEKARAARVKRHRANPEKYRAAYRRWRQEHPEQARAATRAWRQENPEKVKESQQKSERKRNKEQHAATSAAWKKAHPFHSVWRGMIARCYNPLRDRYSSYGGANPPVTVCDRWLNDVDGYENFCADMGPKPTPKHTLGRYLDTGSYTPGNCAWQTVAEQMAERRGKIAMLRYREFKLRAAKAA